MADDLRGLLASISEIRSEIQNIDRLGSTRFPHILPTPRTSEALDQLLNTDAVIEVDGGCCAICLCDYIIGEKKASIRCGHAFHNDCIRPWLTNRNTCPCCRASVEDQPSPVSGIEERETDSVHTEFEGEEDDET